MRDSFDSNTSEERLETNTGVKLQSSRNRVRKVSVKEKFEERVQETVNRFEGHLSRAFNLSKRFAEIMNETKISDNIGPDTRSLEKENITDLINYAIDVNSDQNEREGMGSVSLITLLFNTAIKLRDRVNSLSYKNHLLEMRLNNLEAEMAKLKMSSERKDADEIRESK